MTAPASRARPSAARSGRGLAQDVHRRGPAGAYLRCYPGKIARGDPIEVVHRPAHDVTVTLVFRALMNQLDLLPQLLAAGDDLEAEIRRRAA